jgi:hypothetical protein
VFLEGQGVSEIDRPDFRAEQECGRTHERQGAHCGTGENRPPAGHDEHHGDEEAELRLDCQNSEEKPGQDRARVEKPEHAREDRRREESILAGNQADQAGRRKRHRQRAQPPIGSARNSPGQGRDPERVQIR